MSATGMTPYTHKLPVRCHRDAADEMLPLLRDGIAAGDVAIDGGEVTQLGQAMLQLLFSARKTAANQGVGFAITASDAMRAALASAGAEHLLDESMVR
ncbi:MAG: STAS domain-containing protein [Sphingomonas sp.]|uniref:STAS domain-containing protein n=1 Tax=Sphingomonas sp. TaxID=28214 RepID=UPI0025F2E6EB|nr:STAS domain-containing protein [Sphingomonas sp.]MBY0282364.1 STAS domain-containing protein [Sphingomonas sp.]